MHTRYLGEFRVGEIFESRSESLTEAQIMDFALTWDPQPFHIDKQVAIKGILAALL